MNLKYSCMHVKCTIYCWGTKILDCNSKIHTANHAPRVIFIKTLITCLLLRKKLATTSLSLFIKVANDKNCCKPQVQLTFLYRKCIIVKQGYIVSHYRKWTDQRIPSAIVKSSNKNIPVAINSCQYIRRMKNLRL